MIIRSRQFRIWSCQTLFSLLLPAALLVVLTGIPDPAACQTFFLVDTLDDFPANQSPPLDGLISLREAIVAATTNQPYGDAPAGSPDQLDTVKIIVSGTIALAGDELVCSGHTEIKGLGADELTIDAGFASRHFRFVHVQQERHAWQQVQSVKDVRLINGYSKSDGGSIWHQTKLTLKGVEISSCMARRGGAIYCRGEDDNVAISSFAYGLQLDNCTIAENDSVKFGGGIYSDGPDVAFIAIMQSTIAKNVAGGGGGGVAQDLQNVSLNYYFQGLYFASSTIVDNICSADNEYAVADYSGGVGVYNRVAGNYTGFSTKNSVFARNYNFRTSSNVDVEAIINPSIHRCSFVASAPSSLGLIDGVDGNQIGTVANPLNPGLASLGNFGGPTRTLLPLWGSPLKNTGSNADVAYWNPQQDQRGFARIRFGTVDIGSVER